MKILHVIDYSLNEVNEYIKSGGEYQKHHQWCFDKLKQEGNDIRCLPLSRNTILNKVGKKVGIKNLQLEVDCIRVAHLYDLIFLPQDISHSFMAFCRATKICKTPIFAILHFAYNPSLLNIGHKNSLKLLLKKIKIMMERFLIYKYFDKITFLGQNTFELALESYNIPKKQRHFVEWGADWNFFNTYRLSQSIPPTLNFILANGGSNRDYPILIEAFNKVDFSLKIYGRQDETKSNIKMLPPNVYINNSIIPGLTSVSQLRKEYYNCLAVAIPLKKSMDIACGGTVMLESIAMGKPLLVTNNKAFFFDVEKEKVGYKIDFGDIQGWKQAIEYLCSHPDEVKEMGERALYLARKKYNYNLFAQNISDQIKDFLNSRLS
jgi:glycosyltransferase involved in cell wall biosynthesis